MHPDQVVIDQFHGLPGGQPENQVRVSAEIVGDDSCNQRGSRGFRGPNNNFHSGGRIFFGTFSQRQQHLLPRNFFFQQRDFISTAGQRQRDLPTLSHRAIHG